MSHYEILYLASNQFSEEELNPIKAKVEGFIVAGGGVIGKKTSLGKKRLAYRIKTFRHGYYELVEFEAPAAALPKLNDQLRLASDILRHQIVKIYPKTVEEAARVAKILSQLAQEADKAETAEISKAPIEVKKTEEKSAEPEKPQPTAEELDTQLEQILNTDNLL